MAETGTGTLLTAKWKKIAKDDVLKRSSHAVAAVDGRAYVFGGELVARQPRDGDVHVVDLDGTGMYFSRGLHLTQII